MITQKQIKFLHAMLGDLSAIIKQSPELAAGVYGAEADALAAAIATLEGLPVTKDGVRVGDGDSVWTWMIRPWGATVRTTAIGQWNSERNISKCYSTIEKATAAAKGGEDA